MTLEPSILKAIVPLISQGAMDLFLPELQKFLPLYQIDTPQRIAGFLSQTAEECCNFRDMVENASGEEYEGNHDLGNTEPGDGPRFKGRGPMQLTGREGYTHFSLAAYKDLRCVDHPELLELPDYGVQSACWFWRDWKAVNDVCDLPEDFVHPGPHHYDKFQWMTVKVNGGLNGIATRLANYQRARKVLNF